MFSAVFLAFQALAANKLRAALTMLGTIIGVMCVVTLWNLGESSRRYMSDALSALGENLIFVSPRYGEDEEDQRRNRYRPLTLNDVTAVKEHCPSVKDVSPVLISGARAAYGARSTQIQVWGCFPSYLSICNFVITKGVAFSQADVSSGNRVVLLGADAARDLFGILDPVGQTIRLDRVPFKVGGVLKSKGSFFGMNQDNRVLAPFTTIADHMGWGRNVHQMFVSARERALIPQAKKEIVLAVRESQFLPGDRKDPVEVRDLGETAEAVDKILLGATMFLGAVAAVSLLVGGIGIMNIMLVSVTERTKEIGLRMAIGATDLNVLGQFLIEAAVLSGVGGAIGAGLGVGVAALTVKVLQALTENPWTMDVNPLSIVVAVVFSGSVGVFFGFYPAWRASRLDPIEALRHE